ncbi:hypothetical protein SAMN05720606_13126 [Paenibacillus polysaccharolyticus]|uniref:Uncharacterized protein n=1 Tax=Paenibacillus polysaccharolyticus TaxID=582692 RepID=A0A1G5LNN0_9BACL|nr:hypothetical protein SAMN05720606_13126 [Paenibacillus polysaccharolyticus]
MIFHFPGILHSSPFHCSNLKYVRKIVTNDQILNAKNANLVTYRMFFGQIEVYNEHMTIL